MGQGHGKQHSHPDADADDAQRGRRRVHPPVPIMKVVEEQLEVERELFNPFAFAADADMPQRTAAGAMLVDVPARGSNTMLRLRLKGAIVVHVAEGQPLAVTFENGM